MEFGGFSPIIQPPSKAASSAAEQELQFLRSELQRLALQNSELIRNQQQQQFYQQQNVQPRKPPSLTVVVQNPEKSEPNPNGRNLFLYGPIHSDNWQKTLCDRLEGNQVTIYNPRREDWKTNGLTMDATHWELEYMEKSNIAVFWFSWDHPNFVNTLMELGRCSATKGMIFVGIHQNNKHRKMISEFIRSMQRHVHIVTTLEKLISQVSYWVIHGQLPRRNTESISGSDSQSSGRKS
jgi:hypothetical protein